MKLIQQATDQYLTVYRSMEKCIDFGLYVQLEKTSPADQKRGKPWDLIKGATLSEAEAAAISHF